MERAPRGGRWPSMEATLRKLEQQGQRKRKIARKTIPQGDMIAIRAPDDEQLFSFYLALEMEAENSGETLRVQWLDTTTHDPQSPGSKYYPHTFDDIDATTVICTIRERRPGQRSLWSEFVELSAAEWRTVQEEMKDLDPLEDGKAPSPLPRSSSTASEGASDEDESAASFLSPRESGPNKRPRLAPPGASLLAPATSEGARALLAPTPVPTPASQAFTSPPMSPPRSQAQQKSQAQAPARSPFTHERQGLFNKPASSPGELLRASPARPSGNHVWAPLSSRSPARPGISAAIVD